MSTRYQPGRVLTLSGATFLLLGDASPGAVSSWVVEFRPAGATYTASFYGRVRGPEVDPAATDATLSYTDLTTNISTDGGTAVTATASSTPRIIRVTADGCVVGVDIAALSGGTLDVIAIPLEG